MHNCWHILSKVSFKPQNYLQSILLCFEHNKVYQTVIPINALIINFGWERLLLLPISNMVCVSINHLQITAATKDPNHTIDVKKRERSRISLNGNTMPKNATKRKDNDEWHINKYTNVGVLTSGDWMGVNESHPISVSIFLLLKLSTMTTSCPWSLR